MVNAYKTLDLLPSGLTHTVAQVDGRHEITLASAGLALFVMIEADCEGCFSDNAFDMLAGESRTIIFTPRKRGATPSFVVRDLQSCQATE